MDYCELQKLLQDSFKSRNVFNTLFHGLKIDSYYMERHHIFEIVSELMIRICIDRPENVADYLCQKLREISRKYCRNFVMLEFVNSAEDGSRMLKKMSAQHHFPLIECVNNEMNVTETLKELEKFLKSNLLQKHHLIICNFKENAMTDRKTLRITQNMNEAVSNQNCYAKPHNVLDIPLDENFLSHHRLNYIYQNIRNLKPQHVIQGGWHHRAMIVGRVGAGRKTQGALMAKEFRLILIDLDYLYVQYQQRQRLSEKHKLGFWGFLQETLLKPDCLRNGYVIVCNVISRQDLEIFMEKFICQPNRIIFIHTTETECQRRLKTKEISQVSHANSNDDCLSYQMDLYDLHKKEFVEFFKRRAQKILHIKGTKTIHEIKTSIWANLVS